MSMWPSELRKEMLAQHAGLRERLLQLEAAVGVALEQGAPPPDLYTNFHEFKAALEKHMAFEESMLEPTMATIDAWGPVRVQRMHEDHQRQKDLVAVIDDCLAGPTMLLDELVTATRNFIESLRREMAREEREVLRADVLRDDLVAINQSDG